MFQMIKNRKGTSSVKQKDGRLTIDCTGCPGPSSLEDRQCLICMCDYTKDACDIESIMLHGTIDTSFQGRPLALIRELASVYSVLTMDPGDRRGARCKGCRNSYRRITADQIRCFPDVDTGILRQRAMQTRAQNEVCDICLGDTVRLVDHLESMIEDIKSLTSAEDD